MHKISEAILSDHALPSYFWVVVNIPTSDEHERDSKVLTDLSHCRLKGIRGISDTKQILTSWLGVGRNAAIFLDPDSVERYNDISKVPYDDPDSLVADNLKLLYRVFDKEGDWEYNHDGVMQNIIDYLKPNLNSNDAYTLTYYGSGNITKLWRDTRSGIDSIEGLARFLHEAMMQKPLNIDIDFDELERATRKAIQNIGKTYSDEGEWLIHSSELIFPVGSTMLVGCDMVARDRYDEWLAAEPDSVHWIGMRYRMEHYHALMTTIKKYSLDRRYKIKFIDMAKWEQMRTVLWDRRKKS